jgi:hypothetical protein
MKFEKDLRSGLRSAEMAAMRFPSLVLEKIYMGRNVGWLVGWLVGWYSTVQIHYS